jgi:hypothetical protein
MRLSKNLVVCCDGTNNEIAGDATNVLRLYRMLVRDSEQIAYYDCGVGTIANPDRISGVGRTFSRCFDSAMGLTIRQHFLNAYRFLVRHYEPGDKIFLTGFSRGAYTARAVAGAIHMLGIVRPELEGLADLAWAIYSGENANVGDRFAAANRFKKSFTVKDTSVETVDDKEQDVKVHCVGVWDTVSAFGAISDLRSLPYTANNSSILHIRHALAIDERRAIFQANRFRPKKSEQHGSIKEVWFAGVHSDVGGGYAEVDHKATADQPAIKGSTLSKVSLEWMLREMKSLDLRINETVEHHLMNSAAHPAANPLGITHESLTGIWNLLEVIPQRRFSASAGESTWHWPNFWRRRYIPLPSNGCLAPAPPTLHASVVQRMNHPDVKYQPNNLPSDYLIEP